ncbi:MAG: ABC transporter permease subunit, partial [Gemmataceae bacterium]
QLGEQDIKVGALGRANPKFIVDILRNQLKLNGSAETFRNFIRFDGYTAMIILALAGSILIGNDLRYYSLPFYLSKPISRWDYILGKGLAVAVFINLMTTLPALALFIEFGLLEDWQYLLDNIRLPVGILAYGLILTVSLTSILLATATLLRRSVPLIMTWTALFFFCRLLSRSLVDLLQMDPRFRLIDLWNTTVLLGSTCLGIPVDNSVPYAQPSWQEAALVLGGVTVLCLSYLILRIRGAEIVR